MEAHHSQTRRILALIGAIYDTFDRQIGDTVEDALAAVLEARLQSAGQRFDPRTPQLPLEIPGDD